MRRAGTGATPAAPVPAPSGVDSTSEGRSMDHRRLASLDVSTVGIGCNNFGRELDQDATTAVVHAALEAGVTLFDTADAYGQPRTLSEQYLGAALAGRRDEVVIATKVGSYVDDDHRGAKPAYVKLAVENS